MYIGCRFASEIFKEMLNECIDLQILERCRKMKWRVQLGFSAI